MSIRNLSLYLIARIEKQPNLREKENLPIRNKGTVQRALKKLSTNLTDVHTMTFL